MRKTREKQRPLSPPWPDHQLANELKVISRILDDNPQTLELIVQDLSDRVDSSVGAPGLTAEQVLRCAVIKQADPQVPLRHLQRRHDVRMRPREW